MSEGAIEHIDVPVDDAGETTEQPEGKKPEPKRELSERDKRLAEIAKEYAKSQGMEEQEDPDGEEEPLPLAAEQEEEPKKPKDDLSGLPDYLKDLGIYRNESGDYVTKMKVNGREIEVRADQIKTHLQKDLAGDVKLQEVAAERQRLERERALLEQERAERLQQSMTQNRPPKLDAEDAKKRARALLERVYDGDLDAAAEEFATYLQGSPVDEGKILAEAERRAMTAIERKEAERKQQAWQSSIEEGVQVLKTSHPEVMKDPRLFDLVDGETLRIMERQKQGDPEFASLTPKEIIVRAAKEVDGWRKGMTAPPKTDGTREQRKANLKPMPRGMNAVKTTPKEPEVDLSPAAVIARMRATRAAAN